jgi:hypothetical protein
MDHLVSPSTFIGETQANQQNSSFLHIRFGMFYRVII